MTSGNGYKDLIEIENRTMAFYRELKISVQKESGIVMKSVIKKK